MGGRPKRATRMPLKSPARPPTVMATPSATNNQSSAGAPVMSAPAKFTSISAEITAVRLATPTTDKSIPPVIMVIVMARARMANSRNWKAIETMFCDDRNLSGDKAAMATKTTMAMIASLNSGVDFP